MVAFASTIAAIASAEAITLSSSSRREESSSSSSSDSNVASSTTSTSMPLWSTVGLSFVERADSLFFLRRTTASEMTKAPSRMRSSCVTPCSRSHQQVTMSLASE